MVSPNDHEVQSLNPFTNGIGSNHMGEALTQNFYRKVQNSSMTQLNSSQHSGHFPEKKFSVNIVFRVSLNQYRIYLLYCPRSQGDVTPSWFERNRTTEHQSDRKVCLRCR